VAGRTYLNKSTSYCFLLVQTWLKYAVSWSRLNESACVAGINNGFVGFDPLITEGREDKARPNYWP
jgi:hypothetical protein